MIVLLALLYLLAWTGVAHAAPAIAAALAVALPALGSTAFTVGAQAVTYASILSTAIVTAASIGLSLILAPKAEGGGKQQQTVKQARPPRVRGYGKEKIGGSIFFFEKQANFLHRGIVHCEGPIDAVEETWLNDKVVAFTGSGAVREVNTAPWIDFTVNIETKTGSKTQTVSTMLSGDFDQYTDFSDRWTADHRLKGLCYSVIRARGPSNPEAFGKRFPNGFPDLRVILRLSKIYDPREEAHDLDDEATWEWSDNSALCILDFLMNARGYAISPSRIDMASFEAFADICDQSVPLKGGGNEKRYRLWGVYELTEEPREVLRRMLQTCDAELYMTPEGKVAIRGGVWEEPTITITDAHIKAYNYEQGNDRMAAFNRVTLSFKSPDHDYQITETEEWNDDEAQSLSGEVKAQDLSLAMVPAHGQARRLAKIFMAKGNPRHKLTLQTDMAGLDCLGERIVRVTLSELDLDETFHITKFEILGDLQTCSMELVSLDSSAYAWTAATEEGDPPPIPKSLSDPVEDEPAPDVVGLALSLQRTEVSAGVFVLRIVAEVDPTDNPDWLTQFEYRIDGSSDDWQIMAEGSTNFDGLSDILTDGETYEVRAAHIGNGLIGDYATPETIEAVSDETPPATPTDLGVAPGTGTATVDWLNPNSANYYATRVYRGTTSTFSAATLIATRYGAANAVDVYVDTVAAGTYYWWAVAINGSGVESAPPTPVSGTVT
jgi:hypothetical protein